MLNRADDPASECRARQISSCRFIEPASGSKTAVRARAGDVTRPIPLGRGCIGVWLASETSCAFSGVDEKPVMRCRKPAAGLGETGRTSNTALYREDGERPPITAATNWRIQPWATSNANAHTSDLRNARRRRSLPDWQGPSGQRCYPASPGRPGGQQKHRNRQRGWGKQSHLYC